MRAPNTTPAGTVVPIRGERPPMRYVSEKTITIDVNASPRTIAGVLAAIAFWNVAPAIVDAIVMVTR